MKIGLFAVVSGRVGGMAVMKAFAENAERVSGHGLADEAIAAASRVGLTNERITKQTMKANQV